MDHKTVEDYILKFPKTKLDYPFGENVAVYKVYKDSSDDDGKMFALIMENMTPVNLSLKCDPTLAQVLRDKYDEIMPGYHLNKKHWNTLVLNGQLGWEEVQGLIRHSYDLVAGNT
jgi:predicted DNA-binding protein (MmcQ/YjbR family)